MLRIVIIPNPILNTYALKLFLEAHWLNQQRETCFVVAALLQNISFKYSY